MQDIIDRANVGRTTFYAHFQSKEDLFLSSHDGIIDMIVSSYISNKGVLSNEPSSELMAFLHQISGQSQDAYFHLTWGSDTPEIIRLLRQRIAEQLATRLQKFFNEDTSTIPFIILAQHMAGSMVAIVNWWMDKRTGYSAQDIVTIMHQLNFVTLEHTLQQQITGSNR